MSIIFIISLVKLNITSFFSCMFVITDTCPPATPGTSNETQNQGITGFIYLNNYLEDHLPSVTLLQ